MSAKRPQSFVDFAGQKAAVDVLKVAVLSAKRRKTPLGHVLITGPPGLGKTTLAMSVIPKELEAPARSLVCSAISDPKELLPTLSTMREGEILFLDEIHALPRVCFETLYSVLEDSKLTITFDDKDTPAMEIELPQFTIIGATTREGLIPEPLRDRFKHHARLELYTDAEMKAVLDWTAASRSIDWKTNPGALVQACHGTARHAGTLVDACIDTLFATMGEVGDHPTISTAVIKDTLLRLGYSKRHGFTKVELELLLRLHHATAMVGLNTLAAMLDEEPGTIESVYEPWLLRKGLIEKTPGGRRITAAGRQALCEEGHAQDP